MHTPSPIVFSTRLGLLGNQARSSGKKSAESEKIAPTNRDEAASIVHQCGNLHHLATGPKGVYRGDVISSSSGSQDENFVLSSSNSCLQQTPTAHVKGPRRRVNPIFNIQSPHKEQSDRSPKHYTPHKPHQSYVFDPRYVRTYLSSSISDPDVHELLVEAVP